MAVDLPERRGDYGFDAPHVPLLLGAGGAAMVVVGVLVGTGGWRWFTLADGLFLLANAAVFVHTTRAGKFAIWTELLGRLGLRGDERVLDMGSGRGAVLLMAAQQLPQGRAVGVDLWRGVDQSGNGPDAARRNAELEGVPTERIELHTGDMTAMPFEDASFDAVLSSLAIHNIRGRPARNTAIDEAVRVLRPGGRLVIADISAAADYASRLKELGMTDVTNRPLGWRGWYGGPWMATRAVTASKPT